MSFVSILLPAFYFEDSQIERGLKYNLNLDPHQYEICDILNSAGRREYGVKLMQSQFSLNSIEKLLDDVNGLKNKIDKCKDALTIISTEYNQVVSNPTIQHQNDMEEKFMNKRAKKLKQLKEDNKKLRQLLKAQLENSEKMRVETQSTVETLREEFDLLVRELSNLQKKEQKHHRGSSSNRERIQQHQHNHHYNQQQQNIGEDNNNSMNLQQIQQQQQQFNLRLNNTNNSLNNNNNNSNNTSSYNYNMQLQQQQQQQIQSNELLQQQQQQQDYSQDYNMN